MKSKRLKKRLVIVLGNLDVGGAETQATYLALGMQKKGWDVKIVCLGPPVTSKLSRRLTEAQVSIRFFQAPRETRKSEINLSRLMAIRHYLRGLYTIYRLKPDVIQTFLPGPNMVGAIAGWLLRKRCVCSQRGQIYLQYGVANPKARIVAILTDCIAFTLCTMITTPCQALKDEIVMFYGLDRKKVKVIYNGVDSER